MDISSRYRERLANIPPPGAGCHPALLAVANLGVIAGLTSEQIHVDIRRHIPKGSRKITDSEIGAAISKALSDHKSNVQPYYTPPKSAPFIIDSKVALQRILAQGTISDEADLWDESPIRLWEAP
jgi:hypothetical protein